MNSGFSVAIESSFKVRVAELKFSFPCSWPVQTVENRGGVEEMNLTLRASDGSVYWQKCQGQMPRGHSGHPSRSVKIGQAKAP